MDLGSANRVHKLPDNDAEWEAAVAVKLMCSGCMWRGTGMANGFFSFTCAFSSFSDKELASSLRNKKFCKGVRVHTFSLPRHHEVYVVG